MDLFLKGFAASFGVVVGYGVAIVFIILLVIGCVFLWSVTMDMLERIKKRRDLKRADTIYKKNMEERAAEQKRNNFQTFDKKKFY